MWPEDDEGREPDGVACIAACGGEVCGVIAAASDFGFDFSPSCPSRDLDPDGVKGGECTVEPAGDALEEPNAMERL